MHTTISYIIGACLAGFAGYGFSSSAFGQNLLQNGDFAAGDVQFSSDYKFTKGDITGTGVYDIVKSPRDSSGNATSFVDRSGSGSMLAANGGGDASKAVWRQTVTGILPGSKLEFSGWTAAWYPGNPAKLIVKINGIQIGQTFTGSGTPAAWQRFTVAWNSESATVATIELFDSATGWIGDDFVLDDLSFEYLSRPNVPRRARATATVVNGFVVGVVIVDGGWGYTNTAPIVEILGGGGQEAKAIAQVVDGVVVAIKVSDPGSGYTGIPSVNIAPPPFTPWLEISVSRVKVTHHLVSGRKYQLEFSTDCRTWNLSGPPLTPQEETVTQEFELNSSSYYFRIREIP